jgi:mono/diheme cytochrome c family protein
MHSDSFASGATRRSGWRSGALRTILAGAAMAASAGFSVAQTPTASHPVADGAGKRYYQQICAKCHEAGVGPVITGRGFDPAIYTTFVRYGKAAMPAFRETDIDDATLQDLANYLSKTPAAPAAPAERKVAP